MKQLEAMHEQLLKNQVADGGEAAELPSPQQPQTQRKETNENVGK